MAQLDQPDRQVGDENDVTGEFETHLTIDCADPDVADLEGWAATRGMKLTHIVLARGRTPSQPMLTLLGTGTLRQQQDAAAAVEDDLRAFGHRPVRVKIEAAPWSRGVPEHDAAAAHLGHTRYFEHHVKVLLPAGTDREGLAHVVVRHQAHLSWNARRVDHVGRQETFVTQRCHAVGLHTAGERLERLIGAVTDAGFDIVSVEREFVVYDSNLAVDDGWLELEESVVR